MNKTLLLKKLRAYQANPNFAKEPTMQEMADLVVLVLGAVRQIEDAIKAGRLDGKTPEADKDYVSHETATKFLTSSVNEMLQAVDYKFGESKDAFEQRVQQAIDNIRDGENGIVTEEDIMKAADLAFMMIELPDFDALVTEKIQGNGAVMRDALESLPEGDEQLSWEAIGGLKEKLEELAKLIQIPATGGGTIGKNQVYNWIKAAVADGTIPAGGSGSGDMLKSTYDTNDDGVVDEAATITSQGALATLNTVGTSQIDNDAVTFDKIQNVNTNKLIGRDTAGIGSVEEIAVGTGLEFSGASAIQVTNYNNLLDTDDVGVNNGVASLDSGGKVPASQLPNSIMDYNGTWAASTNTPTLANGTGNAGDVYVASDAGTVDFGAGGISFTAGDWVIYSGSIWEKSVNSNAVASVNGQTGVVTVDVVDDTTPQLGGNLDVNGNSITSASNGDVTITPNGTGQIVLSNNVNFGANVSSDVIPSVDNSYSLGSPSNAWAGMYLNALQFGTNSTIYAGDGTTELISLTNNASAVNQVDIANSATGNALQISAAGGDTNISLNLIPKGSGEAQVAGNKIIDETDAASTTAAGIVELATTAEVDTGTDTTRAITPSALNGSSPDFVSITYDTAISTPSALGNLGATETIDWSTATLFTGTLDSNVTITFSNATAGQKISGNFAYDGTAQRTITWPTVKWPGGTAPTTPAASGEIMKWTIEYDGTNYLGSSEVLS